MAITVQAGTGVTFTQSSDGTIPLPADVAVGDLLLLLIDITSDLTATSPGYTEIQTDTGSGVDRFRLLKKTAGASEAAPVVTPGASTNACAMVVRVRGCDTATGPAQITQQLNDTTTASIDPPTTGSVKIAIVHTDPGTAGTVSWGSGATSLGGIAYSNLAYVAAAYKLEDTAAAITYTFSGSASGSLSTVILSIAPAATTTYYGSSTVSLTDTITTVGKETQHGVSTVSLTDAQTTAGTRKTFGSSTVALVNTRATAGTVTAAHVTYHGSAVVHAYLHVTTGSTASGVPVAPVGRFLVAFDDDTLEPNPVWTRLDSTPHLVTSYTIDRGRQYELDRTDVGRATVQIMDPHGILDPTNTAGPYYGRLEPLLQATIGRYDPVAGAWFTRYRGFIEEIDYTFDPSQNFNRLTLTLVDIFEILSAVEMLPGEFGDAPPSGSEGQVFFDNAGMQDRILQVLANANIPDEFKVVFSGNVMLYEATYSAAESAMTAVQEAADAEFPGVSNVYTDRLGRLAVHGRLAKFDPAGTAASADIGSWLFTHWKAGDGQTVAAHPSTTAHIRQLAYNRGLGKIINQALATPVGIADADVAGQMVNDPVSIGRYGIRAWSAQNLLTKIGVLDSADDLVETKRFATYYVQNYMAPRNRITSIQFRSMAPGQVGAAANWRLLSQVDISDLVDVTVTGSGGGGFTAEPFFVEGVHEQVQPLNAVYDDVTLTLDLSPQAYWTDNPFPVS